MSFWLTSLAILVQFLGIATAAAHRELRDTANPAGFGICVTQECNNTASKIIKDMNLKVNPCDDFYEYTCGSFLKRDLPSGTSFINSATKAKTQFKLQLKSVFDADYALDDTWPVKLQKILYKACMNEESIERKGVRPLKMLTQMLGGWPVLEGASWNESKFDWMATTAAWTRAGLPAVTFMKIGIEADRWNSLQNVLDIAPPTWIISRSDLNKGVNESAATRAYYTLMVDVAVSLGADRTKAEAELEVVLLFHMELSNSIVVANRGTLRLTLKTLTEHYPGVNWRDTFARMYSPTQTIGDDDVVVVHSPMFINNVITLVSRIPKRILANFAMFQIITSRMRTMNKEMIEKLDAFKSAKNNYVEYDPRWISCTDMVIDGLPVGVTDMYAKKLLKPETKLKFVDIIQNIRQEFRANIDKVPFLDDVTRTSAKKKESAIRIVVGHLNQLSNNDAVDKYYDDLDLFDDIFFDSLRLGKFDFDIQVREFRKPINYVNSTDSYRYFLTRIAYASQPFNYIAFAPTSLQDILFNPEQPRYINFATAGTTIGHEITHLFDNQGVWYVENGGNNYAGILTMTAKVGFQAQVRCLKNQYRNYTDLVINRNVDGHMTLDENIADNAGVKRAYHAYVNAMSGKTPEKRLPGLDFTPNQMFWIAYGNMYCEKWTPSYMKSIWDKEKHAMSRFRVIGSVSNSEEFAKDFNCQLGSAMNPAEKCSIW